MVIKLVTVDVDGCLVSYENVGSSFHSSWDALGVPYGLSESWKERLKCFYGKREKIIEWTRLNVDDLKGREIKVATEFLYPLPYCKGAIEFAKLTKNKLVRGLLTTSIDLVAEKAANELEMDFVFCNHLHKDNGRFTGTFDYNVPLWDKHELIPQICEKYKVRAEEICHIGDNENDISVGERVGLFIAVNPKCEQVRKKAQHIFSDFSVVAEIIFGNEIRG